MYYIIAFALLSSHIMIWFLYQDKISRNRLLIFASHRRPWINRLAKRQFNNSKEKELKKPDLESDLDYCMAEHKLNWSLKTLEFIHVLENNLGNEITSSAFTPENLEELLELKKSVQENILKSTKKHLEK